MCFFAFHPSLPLFSEENRLNYRLVTGKRPKTLLPLGVLQSRKKVLQSFLRQLMFASSREPSLHMSKQKYVTFDQITVRLFYLEPPLVSKLLLEGVQDKMSVLYI